jgi:hypothetical protein
VSLEDFELFDASDDVEFRFLFFFFLPMGTNTI